jgi:hypothetical protein
MKYFPALLLLVCSVACIALARQTTRGVTKHNDGTKTTKIVFHVTSVRYEEEPDFCGDGTCSATKTTVEGYADSMQMNIRVMFVLNCDEMLAFKPTPKITVSCGSVHANNDYDVWVYDNAISFWPPEKYTLPPFHGTFRIASEKEVSMPNK